MPAWRVSGDDALSGRTAGVDAVGEFPPLEYAQVHIGMIHSSQCRPQPPVSAVTNVVGAESNLHPPSRRSLSTPTHILPTYAFFPSLLCCPPRLLRPHPSSVPGPVLPTPVSPFRSRPCSCPYYFTCSRTCSNLSSILCAVHLGMGYSLAP